MSDDEQKPKPAEPEKKPEVDPIANLQRIGDAYAQAVGQRNYALAELVMKQIPGPRDRMPFYANLAVAVQAELDALSPKKEEADMSQGRRGMLSHLRDHYQYMAGDYLRAKKKAD